MSDKTTFKEVEGAAKEVRQARQDVLASGTHENALKLQKAQRRHRHKLRTSLTLIDNTQS